MLRDSFVRLGPLLLGLAALDLQAQSLALPASDPVGIGRGGAGVAFGRSLEAGALNPALLATVEDRASAYLAGGMELQSGQFTLQSNQRVLYSTDRNRSLPAFGGAWRGGAKLTFGIVVDTPFARHLRLPLESTARFLGDRVDLRSERVQFQTAFKVSDHFSLGVGVGAARLTYTAGATVRAQVPVDPSQPLSASNPSQGLMETGLRQSARGFAPSLVVGFRYALNPRWTIGGAFQGPIKKALDLDASLDNRPTTLYANDGYSAPAQGTAAAAAALLPRLSARAGEGDLQLPWKLSLGVRQRVNQLFTWELDLRYIGAGQFSAPGGARLLTPSGTVTTPVLGNENRASSGGTLLGELNLSKDWTVRAAASLEGGWTSEATVNPMLGGAKTAAFSAGLGFKVWGGELSAGYQFRQSRDVDSSALDGAWSRLGYRPTGSATRLEGMGHLFSIGFRRSF